jgi:hypothetical protein
MGALSPELLAMLKGAKAKHTRQNNRTFKLKEGKTRLRILPAKDPNAPFWQDFGMHWIKDPTGKVEAVTACHDATHDHSCPVCAMVEKAAKAATSDEELKFIKEMKAKRVVLVNALIRNSDNPTTPQILELTPTTFTSILSVIEEYADEMGNILDLKTGLDFTIERVGKGLDTEYKVMPAPKSEAVPPAVLEHLNDLKAFVDGEFTKETKALNAIASMTGLTAPVAFAGPGTRAALTGPRKPTIVDAEVIEEEPPFETKPKTAPKTEAKGSKPAAKPAKEDFGAEVAEEEIDDILAGLED